MHSSMPVLKKQHTHRYSAGTKEKPGLQENILSVNSQCLRREKRWEKKM